MLTAFKQKSRTITKSERKGNALYLYSEHGTHRITPVTEEILHVEYTTEEDFRDKLSPGIVNNNSLAEWTFSVNGDCVELKTLKLVMRIDKETGSYSFINSLGDVLFKEREYESKNLERYEKKKLSDEKQEIDKVQTADGAKDVVRNARLVSDGFAYHTRLYVEFGDEALYGLGQHEEGYASLRGKTVYLHQGNRKIAVPMLVSTKNYGILSNTYSPAIFNDSDDEPYIYCESDSRIDYYFIASGSMDGVIAGYRTLTGKAVMLPRWSFGFVQSQERYETEDEILDVAEKTRKLGFGLDCMVLDWLSWGDNQWGQKTLDKTRFGNYRRMTDRLHSENIHFMISVWPNSGDGTANNTEFKEKGLLLPGCGVYNALDAEARRIYWKQLCEDLVPGGTDAWWCDSSEPFTPEWSHMERVEPAKLYNEYVSEVGMHLSAEMLNSFSLFHAQGIYEGQRGFYSNRSDMDDYPEIRAKRVCNLTRSAYIGQQRYGVICWSGDIGASWKTLKKQIPAGLNFSASGLPYWSIDIGAFFVKRGNFWYWDGAYDETSEDMGYRELFTRWYQWGAFLPVFRVHGTDCRREMWNFGEDGDIFYEALKKANRLRYSLLPYIYSQAGMVWLENKSMIRFLTFDFPNDKNVWDINDQYMFGESLMVCPVTEPMYYEKNSRRLENISKSRKVYLPAGCDWFDYYTGKKYAGGITVEADAEIDRIPLFVKEGAVIPVCLPGDSAAESGQEILYKVFAEKDASAVLYDDDGDGYAYENGDYKVTEIRWNAATGVLEETCAGKTCAVPKDRYTVAVEKMSDEVI